MVLDIPGKKMYNKYVERTETKGETTMKNLNEISVIITEMSDKDFNHLNDATTDYYFSNPVTSRKAYKRMMYYLRKHNLTRDEWEFWCAG